MVVISIDRKHAMSKTSQKVKFLGFILRQYIGKSDILSDSD